jgi:hypothetical protein
MLLSQYVMQQPQHLLRRVTMSGLKSMQRKHHSGTVVGVAKNQTSRWNTVMLQKNIYRTFSSTSTTTAAAATTSDLVNTKFDFDFGIAEVTMQNGSVNSLSLEM